MRAPDFWRDDPPSIRARLLMPIGAVYGALTAARMRRAGASAGVPVICVGNFTAGGAGKTPTAIAVARMLLAQGERPVFLTRGHGGRLAGPVAVEAGLHGHADVGDEPLLLAEVAPTIVSRDRIAGARACREAGASVIVMDDGLQNPSLRKDFRLVVVDGEAGVQNGLCLPAGPLRAPLSAQWDFVDALVVMGPGEAGRALAEASRARGKRAFHARLRPDPSAASSIAGEKVLAFAGIGRPEKFFATLEACGARIVARAAFPDHHAFTGDELAGLRAKAGNHGAMLVTTCKDLMRIAEPGEIVALPVAVEVDDGPALEALLGNAVAQARKG